MLEENQPEDGVLCSAASLQRCMCRLSAKTQTGIRPRLRSRPLGSSTYPAAGFRPSVNGVCPWPHRKLGLSGREGFAEGLASCYQVYLGIDDSV